MYVQTILYICPMEKSKYCGCLYYSANALSRIMTKMADEEFASAGLSSSYAFLLMTVNHKPGIQPKEISEQMQLTPSTVTRLIEKLEYRGLLKRQQSGRATEVFATEEGDKLAPKVKKAWSSLYQRYTGILGKDFGDQLTASITEASMKLDKK